jgi:hypothetical protein
MSTPKLHVLYMSTLDVHDSMMHGHGMKTWTHTPGMAMNMDIVLETTTLLSLYQYADVELRETLLKINLYSKLACRPYTYCRP